MTDTLMPAVQRRDIARAAALCGLPLLFVLVLSLRPIEQTLLQPDSAGYLSFSGMRTGGYPFFLSILSPLIGEVRHYVAAQLIFYAVAVAVLAWQIYRLSGSVFVALAAELLLLGNPAVDRYHFTILTESVFLSTSALFLAGVIAYLRKPAALVLAFAALAAGYAAAIRPTGLAFIPAALLLAFLVPRLARRPWLHLAVATVAAFGVLALESVYYHATHSGPRQSLVPMHTFAKGGLVEVPDAEAILRAGPSEAQPLQRAVESALAPVRKLIAGAPNALARCRLVANYETYIQYRFAQPERVALIGARGDGALLSAGLSRLSHAPAGYVDLTADNLYCLWTVWIATDAEKAALSAYLAERRPLPFDEDMYASLATLPSGPAAALVRPVMWSAAIVFALAGLAVLWSAVRGRVLVKWLVLLGLCGLLLHVSLLLTALAGVAIPRYTLALWVPLCVGAGAAAIAALRALRHVVQGPPTR